MQSVKKVEMLYILFLCEVFEFGVYFSLNTSQFRLTTCQVLSSHMWRMATMLDSIALNHILHIVEGRYLGN